MSDDDLQKTTIHGYTTKCSRELSSTGVRYLRDDLQYKEAKTLFDAARYNGSAYFEDGEDRDFTLEYKRNEGVYYLSRRSDDG